MKRVQSSLEEGVDRPTRGPHSQPQSSKPTSRKSQMTVRDRPQSSYGSSRQDGKSQGRSCSTDRERQAGRSADYQRDRGLDGGTYDSAPGIE